MPGNSINNSIICVLEIHILYYACVILYYTTQLRLDFSGLTLAQPETTDNKCNDDQFIGPIYTTLNIKKAILIKDKK